MASFNYDAYAAQQEARKSTNPNGGLGPEVQFVSNYLKNDGDVIVVRFPYHSMSELVFETTHAITFPGRRYPSRVRCDGADCAFCAQGVKIDTRFFAKLLVYVIDETNGEVKRINAVWDRPSAFADIEIKNLMQEYGDISNFLFKLKRNGNGTATRYTISIVMNNTVYNPEVYKADFTELASVDPVKILSKSSAQYIEALTESGAPQQHAVTTPVQAPTPAASTTAPVANTTYVQPAATPAPVAQTVTAPQPATQVVNTPAPQEVPGEQRRPTTKYQF